MAYCTNCGHQLVDEAKYCSNCGIKLGDIDEQHTVKYTGEIHKCPNCGENLSAFIAECPSCGYELRGTKTSSSVKDFSNSLEKKESEEQRVNLIRNFPIPNNKEDIFEFLILASTNIVGEKYKVVFEAWIAKFEQCYEKAKLVVGNDADFEKIQRIYKQTTKSIQREKTKHNVRTVGKMITGYFSLMSNPIFGIVVILVTVYAFIRFVKGDFAGIDILFDALILLTTYRITNNKKNNEK